MGLLTAAAWAPNLLLSLHAGAWVDRSGRPREAMIAADLGRAALLVTVPVAWALGVLTFGQLVAVAFATGALGALATVAYGSLYGALVTASGWSRRASLISGSRAGAGVAGPSVGRPARRDPHRPVRGARRRRVVRRSAWWLRRVAVPRRAPDADPGGLADGVRFIARSPLVRPILAATATLNVFTFAISALFVLYATRRSASAPRRSGSSSARARSAGVLGSLVDRADRRPDRRRRRLRRGLRALHGADAADPARRPARKRRSSGCCSSPSSAPASA